ncbi:MAG: membrane protein insertase YidC [Acidimicrobiia bacterium]|nr:membrane protein insertase YidC [Acidimicrobiia bacterium]
MNPWNMLLEGMGNLLAFFYNIIPNYGIAIVLLTLLISVALFPLTVKQTRSMRAMQEIQPEVKKLQKEYKGNREELNKKMMELYQERGVNPAAGCLPLLVQMPIWFALFSVLRVNRVTRTDFGTATNDALGVIGADPILPDQWVRSSAIPEDSSLFEALVQGDTVFLSMDMLTSPSAAVAEGLLTALPYIIMVVIVIVASYYQQYQTTRRRGDQEKTPQTQGMQTAMRIMPLFFGFISWGFPAGLVLYWAVSNLFRVGQQAYLLRDHDNEKAAAAAVVEAAVVSPEFTGRSPNASKKKNRRKK